MDHLHEQLNGDLKAELLNENGKYETDSEIEIEKWLELLYELS